MEVSPWGPGRIIRDYAFAVGGKGQVFSKFGVNMVELIGEFHETHQIEIDRLATAYQTVDCASGLPSGRSIPAAKVIDIYGFDAACYR